MAKLTKSNKILIMAGLALAGFGVWWFFIRTKNIANTPAIDADDEQAYNRLYSLLVGAVGKDAIDGWVGEHAADVYAAGSIGDSGRLINGKVTKTGALLEAWAVMVYPNSNIPVTGDRNTINEQAYSIFYGLRGKQIKLA